MKMRWIFFLLFFLITTNCTNNKESMSKEQTNIIFLHHSTGKGVWRGKVNKYIHKLTKTSEVEKLVKKYNEKNGVEYSIKEQVFPKNEPYGWNNYPYDYYNIWVKNAGNTWKNQR